MGPRLGEAVDGLRLAGGRHRRRQRFSRRPAAAQCGASSAAAAPRSRQLLGEPGVQLLALAGQDRRVDGFGQQRVAEAEGAGVLVGDEHLWSTARRSDVGRGPRRARGAAGSRRRAPRRRPAAAGPGSRRRAGDALEQQVAQAARQLAGVAGREELLGEEGLPAERADGAAGSDRAHAARRRAARQARRPERTELEHEADPERRTRRQREAPEAASAVGAEQEDPLFGEVVGEEDDEVERRRVRPVQVLEHQQHRDVVIGESASAASNTRNWEPGGGGRGPPRRRASTNGWYGSSVPTRSIDRPSGRRSRPRGRGGQLEGEPGLADARLARDQHRRAVPRPRVVERLLELPSSRRARRTPSRGLHAARRARRRTSARQACQASPPHRDGRPSAEIGAAPDALRRPPADDRCAGHDPRGEPNDDDEAGRSRPTR